MCKVSNANRPNYHYSSNVLFAALTVFFINIVIVIGPTPPGTGEIAFALGSASSNATSPTSPYPLAFVASTGHRQTECPKDGRAV